MLRLCCLLAAAPLAEAVMAAPPTRDPAEAAQVLVVTGSDPFLPAFVLMDQAMRATVAKRQSVNWLHESLDAMRFGAPDVRFAEALARKYEGVRIDAVMLVTEPAVEFHLRHGRLLWPGVPVVYNFVPSAFARALPADARLSGLSADIDYVQTLRIAAALQPDAQKLIIVGGVSPWDRLQLAAAQQAAAAAGRTQVEVLAGPTPAAIAARLSKTPRDTIVLFTTLLADADKQVYVPRDVLTALSAASAVPVYSAIDTYMGEGLTAGAIESFHARGERLGELLLRALAEPNAAPLNANPPLSQCVADARQLTRFGLDSRRLPAGCELRHVEPSLLRQHWWQFLLVALALAGQSLLIATLLLQRRRRRAAELGYAAQRGQLLHASRLAVAGELTASIAHEINQPLGAILSNADAAEMLVQSGRIRHDELLQILADIKRDDLRASAVVKRLRALLARHDVERRGFDAHQAVRDSVAILGAEARRRGAVIETALDARDSAVVGDSIQLQQVIINLVLNAFDASAGLPAGERRVRVATADAPDGLRITVRDFGSGIAAADLPQLFTSFFTTKSRGMGLGLSIARSIVEAHGGTIAAAARAPGAEFEITLPTSPAARDADPLPANPTP